MSQFGALLEEIVKRLGMKQQILTFTLIAAGTFLGIAIGIGTQVAPSTVAEALLVYPLVAMFLAADWAHHETQAVNIGQFPRRTYEVDPRVPVRYRWEDYINTRYGQRTSGLAVANHIGGRYVFLWTQVLVLAVAVALPSVATFATLMMTNDLAWALLAVDGAAVLVTVYVTFVSVPSRNPKVRKPRIPDSGAE